MKNSKPISGNLEIQSCRKSSRLQVVTKRKLELVSESIVEETTPLNKKSKLKKRQNNGSSNGFNKSSSVVCSGSVGTGNVKIRTGERESKATVGRTYSKILPAKEETHSSEANCKAKRKIVAKEKISKSTGIVQELKQVDDVIYIDDSKVPNNKINEASIWATNCKTPSIWCEEFTYISSLPNHVQCLKIENEKKCTALFKYTSNSSNLNPVVKDSKLSFLKIRKQNHEGKSSFKDKAIDKTIAVTNVLWTECYKPSSLSEFIGSVTNIEYLASWLLEWKNKGVRLENDSSNSSYECSDIDDEMIKCVLITGATGVGKTSVVYTMAQEYKFKVFEVNSSSIRGSKQIMAQLQEATQSHHVEGSVSNPLARFIIKNAPDIKEVPIKVISKISTEKKRGRGRPRKEVAENKSIGITAYFKKSVDEINLKVPEAVNDIEEKEKPKPNSIKNWFKRVKKTDSKLQETDPKLHKTDSTLHKTDSTLHKTDSTLHKTDPTLHKTDSTLHKTDPTLHKTDPKLHKTKPKLHKTDPKLHKTKPKLHKTDPKLQKNDPKLQKTEPKLQKTDPKLQKNDPKLQKTDPKLDLQTKIPEKLIDDKNKISKETKTLIPKSSNLTPVGLPEEENQGLKFSSSSIILFDDVDLVFDEDEGFWSSVNNFIKLSKKPVILTASRSSDYVMGCINSNFETLNLDVNVNQCTKFLRKLIQDGKMNQKKDDLKLIIQHCKKDIRKILLQTQFWANTNEVESNYISPIVKYCLEKPLRSGVFDYILNSEMEDSTLCLENFKNEGYFILHANLEIWLPLPKKVFNNKIIKEEMKPKAKKFMDISWATDDNENQQEVEEIINRDPLSLSLLNELSNLFDDFSKLDCGYFNQKEVYDDFKTFSSIEPHCSLSSDIGSWQEVAFCKRVNQNLTNTMKSYVGDLSDSVHLRKSEFKLENFDYCEKNILNAVNLISGTVIPVQHVNSSFEKIEYISALKAIDEIEILRCELNFTRTRRFHHYFDQIGLNIDQPALNFLSKMLK